MFSKENFFYYLTSGLISHSLQGRRYYSTVTDLAKLRGLSTSVPLLTAV